MPHRNMSFSAIPCGHGQAYNYLEGALAQESAFLRKAVQSHLKRRNPKDVQFKELAKKLEFADNEHEHVIAKDHRHPHDLGMLIWKIE